MDDQWLTYAELGARLGLTQQAARHLARRRGWRIQLGNDKVTRVLLPDGATIRLRAPKRVVIRKIAHSDNSKELNELRAELTREVTIARERLRYIDSMQSQLIDAVERAARAEAEANDARKRLADALQSEETFQASVAAAAERAVSAEAQAAAHQADVATLRAAEREIRTRLAAAEGAAKAAEAALAKQKAEAAERATWSRWRRLWAASRGR